MNIIIDLIRKKNEHHVFNSETIKALESITTNNHYYLDVNSSSMDFIHNKKNITNINVNSSKLYFWLHSSLMLIRILLSNKSNNIILLSSTPLQYLICSIISKYTNTNTNIFMHGELGYLNSSEGRGQKIGASLLGLAFKMKSKVNFIAINEYIYNKLTTLYPYTKFHCIEHPLQQYDLDGLNKNHEKNTLNIGSFGIQSKEKNSEKIYELSERLKDLDSKVKLQTIGITNGSFEYNQKTNVKHYCCGDFNSALIPEDIFLSHVLDLDFVLFFNSGEEKYDLIPSGVFSDCIALELPIIALTNPKLEFFFKKYGELGILCEDIESMENTIRNLSSNSSEREKYKASIKIIKRNLNFSCYRRKISEVVE